MNSDIEEKVRFLLDPPEEAARKIHAVRHRSDWQEPLRLAIHTISRENPIRANYLIRTAILADPETDEFKKSAFENILYRDLILAAKCICECETPDEALIETLMRPLVDIVLWRNNRGTIDPL